jgi:hypothetical protein
MTRTSNNRIALAVLRLLWVLDASATRCVPTADARVSVSYGRVEFFFETRCQPP